MRLTLRRSRSESNTGRLLLASRGAQAVNWPTKKADNACLVASDCPACMAVASAKVSLGMLMYFDAARRRTPYALAPQSYP
jgi:hypothetical protein